MATNHFACTTFGCREQEELIELTYRAADVDNPDLWPPRCETCHQPMEKRPQPGDFCFDLKTDGDGNKGFQKFTVDRLQPDGSHRREVIDSLHKVRQVEKESEQAYLNGEGEPLRFRGYAQDRSNIDVGSFGDSGTIGGRAYSNGQTPTKKKNIGVARHGQERPKIPVARGAGASPLKG